VKILEEKYNEEIKNKKLILIHKDVLEFEPSVYGIEEGKYKIIANIPYNITGAIIKKFLSETLRPKMMVLLVQKEVAERIVARDKKESILSISVKAYADPLYMMKVGKRFFSPSPKVDSAIIAIRDIHLKYFTNKKEELAFFTILKAAFAHKRKVMRKNLEDIAPKEAIDILFTELSIDQKVRAEDVEAQLWPQIVKKLQIHLA
jgi:16S rRNA (adenine1518-N6/adenine1519-N6)-dimethyltransferase